MPSFTPNRPYRRLRRRWENDHDVRFMTFSCHHRLPLLNNPAIMDLFVTKLVAAREKFSFSRYACVVMPEHVHLLFRPPPGGSWAEIAESLKTSIARRVLFRWRQLDAPILKQIRVADGTLRFWLGGGGFDRNIRDQAELAKEIGYIHRNPVRRGLVQRPEQWRWSTVHWWTGRRDDCLIPCDLPPGDPNAWTMWSGYK